MELERGENALKFFNLILRREGREGRGEGEGGGEGEGEGGEGGGGGRRGGGGGRGEGERLVEIGHLCTSFSSPFRCSFRWYHCLPRISSITLKKLA